MDPAVDDLTGAALRGRTRPRWWKRLSLVVFGPVVVLGFLEGILRLCSYGTPPSFFIPDSEPGFFRTNPDFTSTYLPSRFDLRPLDFRIRRNKEVGHIRIFVLGESAARGIPEAAFGFSPLLRAQLRSAFPQKQFEVYNLGIAAINSHVVLKIAQDAAAFEPDLFLVYMGNNEVVGPFGPGSATNSEMPPLALIRASIWTRQTRTGQLMRNLLDKVAGVTRSSVQWHGMSTYIDKTVRANDSRLAQVYDDFETNLTDIVEVARKHSVRMVVSTVVCNLRDAAPFASLHRLGITRDDLARWQSIYAEAVRQWEIGQPVRSAALLREAIDIDPEYAEAHFLLGSVLEDVPSARAELLSALHWDALRFRPDETVNDLIRRVASKASPWVELADAAVQMGSDRRSDGPIAGRNFLWEHVHLNWEGNNRLGLLLAEKVAQTLFSGASVQGSWLGSEHASQAVGYTPYGKIRVLRALQPILTNPPFTNQLTYSDDQSRYQHQLEKAVREASQGENAARALLEASASKDPGNADILLRLAEVEFESSHPERALNYVDRAIENAPLSAELLVRRAQTLLALNRSAEAESATIQAIKMNPEHLPAYTELVSILRKTGNFGPGRSILLRAIKRNPGSDYLQLTLADLLFYHGDRDEAVQACEGVLSRNPASAEALGRLVSLFNAQGRKEDVFGLMLQAAAAQPGNFKNNMELARIYKSRNDDGKVAKFLQMAELSGPAEPQVHIFLARRFLRLHQPDQALLEFARARRVAVLEEKEDLADKVTSMMQEVTP